MSDRNPQKNDKAIRLRPDNFTPPARTPWGGRRIVERYKAGLVQHDAIVGESWEISVEPDFPSCTEDGQSLADVITADPDRFLGKHVARGSTALLVKLLDTAAPLSVQIHPADDDPRLGANESGKPEAWYILEAGHGAGLYIGLQPEVTASSMREAIEADADVSKLLCFVPVEPGDFFVIAAGTPHAIGAGITLVEPQRVLPGRRGLTYRYWDWNRRYGDGGRLDPLGAPRALHVEDALRVTRWDLPRGEALLESIRVRAGVVDPSSEATSRVLADDPIRVRRLAGQGSVTLPALDELQGLTVLEGAVHIHDQSIGRGQSAVLPAAAGELTVELEGAHALLCSVP